MARVRINRILVRWGLRGMVIVLAIITALIGVAAWSAFQKERASRLELRATLSENQALVLRKAALEVALHALETPRGIEEAIRERYPVVKPGEEVITLVSQRPATTSTPRHSGSIWDSVKNWLGL